MTVSEWLERDPRRSLVVTFCHPDGDFAGFAETGKRIDVEVHGEKAIDVWIKLADWIAQQPTEQAKPKPGIFARLLRALREDSYDPDTSGEGPSLT